MPQFTEARIQELCTEAITVQTSEDVARVVGELREAIDLHIRLARESLEARASVIPRPPSPKGSITMILLNGSPSSVRHETEKPASLERKSSTEDEH